MSTDIVFYRHKPVVVPRLKPLIKKARGRPTRFRRMEIARSRLPLARSMPVTLLRLIPVTMRHQV